MIKLRYIVFSIGVCLFSSVQAAETGSHLFILSGQSNMQRLDPKTSFIPAVEEAFGKENVIIVHHAVGGKAIANWYKQEGIRGAGKPQLIGKIYDVMMEKVNAAIEGKDLASVTFVWMQGERDANNNVKNGDVYAEYLQGLIDQLSADMGRDDLNVVIGRLSDFGTKNPGGKQKYEDWAKVREAQVAVADSNPRYAWVDCDDLNDEGNKKNDLHLFPDTYPILGQRFADAAIELIKAHSK
jgi:hypothetical protein